MLFLIAILLVAFLLFTAIVLIVSSVTNAPYLPSDAKSVQAMVSLADVRVGEKMADLGSGDGRIVIAFAKAGVEAHGYEVNLFLVWWSRWKIRREKLSDNAFIHPKSFWREDLSSFNIITIFTLPYFMPRLEKKLQKEKGLGLRIVTNGVAFPNLRYLKKNSEHGIYLYKL